jgi:CBS domain-containing protein
MNNTMRSFEKPVRDYMATPVHTVTVDDDVSDAEKLLREKRVSCLAVVGRDGKMAGVISENDLLQIGHILGRIHGGHGMVTLPASCVGDVITGRIVSCAPDATMGRAAQAMIDGKIHRLFVLEGEKPVGVVSTRDMMRVLMDEQVKSPVADWMTRRVVTIASTATIADAVEKLVNSRAPELVVLEGDAPAGLFTQAEAVEAREQPPAAPVSTAASYSLVTLPGNTPLFRAAGFALSTRARRVLVIEGATVQGVLNGLDFTRAVAQPPGAAG